MVDGDAGARHRPASATRLPALRHPVDDLPGLQRQLRQRPALPTVHVRKELSALPPALDLDVSSGPSSRPAGEREHQPRRQLRLVGLPRSARVIRHEPPAPLSYGVDYSFLHLRGRAPVRWPAGRPITVRVASADPVQPDLDLDPIIRELAELTGLVLQVGEPMPGTGQLAEPAADQILVCVAPRLLPAWPDGSEMRCVGTAIQAGEHGDYIGGLVRVGGDPDHAGRLDWQLRHGLGHALGLGHAHRGSELMYAGDRGNPGWGPGDRAGLRLVGHRP
jgi:hypothetical protein